MSAWLCIPSAHAQESTGVAPPVSVPDGAPAPSTPAGYHEHDGYWMRLQLGWGSINMSGSRPQEGQHQSSSGGGVTFAAAFGGVVRRNLVVYGELLGAHAANAPFSPAGDAKTIDLTVFGVGPGVTYFVAPYDIFLSASVTFTAMTESTAGALIPSPADSTTSLGIGANLMVGKEWWLSAHWGLGLAAQARFFATARDDLETTFSGSIYSLLVSSTFN